MMRKYKSSKISFRSLNIYLIREILSFILFRIENEIENGFTYILKYTQTYAESGILFENSIWKYSKFLDLFGKWGNLIHKLQRIYFLWNTIEYSSYIDFKHEKEIIHAERDKNALNTIFNYSCLIRFHLSYMIKKPNRSVLLEEQIKKKIKDINFIEKFTMCHVGVNLTFNIIVTNNQKYYHEYLETHPTSEILE